MADAVLKGPVAHPRGQAFTVETMVFPGEPPLKVRWKDFKVHDLEESWSFRWQCRADRMTLRLQAAARGDFDRRDIFKDKDFTAFFDDVGDAYRAAEDIDGDEPVEAVQARILQDIEKECLDLYDSMDFKTISSDDFDREALQALPLPRWARVEDRRPKGRLLLVFSDGRTMEDFGVFLKTGRSPRRPQKPSETALKILMKYASRGRRGALRSRKTGAKVRSSSRRPKGP